MIKMMLLGDAFERELYRRVDRGDDIVDIAIELERNPVDVLIMIDARDRDRDRARRMLGRRGGDGPCQ